MERSHVKYDRLIGSVLTGNPPLNIEMNFWLKSLTHSRTGLYWKEFIGTSGLHNDG